jgi:outer membrane receptor protein involved in Fe transport
MADLGTFSTRTILRTGAGLAAIALASANPALAQDAVGEGEAVDTPEIIVTGVFGEQAIEDAPISIEALSGDELTQVVPVSSADLLKKVPGVYVNSAFGEIRNVVFSRGVSANSADAASGYYYVSLQEDGLPVESITAGNFGPDFFSRPDLMLSRVEALRGGTAVVTGANAPGGIFNYVLRTGRSHPGTEAQARLGLEGNGKSPYYRADLYSGGELGSNLYFAIGGFYRHSDGARDPGYASNRGGQIRGNLLWEYGDGTLQLSAKYLDDRNSFFEFLPAFDYDDPQLAEPFDNYSSVLPAGSGAHDYVGSDGVRRHWDPKSLVRSRSASIGLNWTHQIYDGVEIRNNFRASLNRTNWNSGAVIFATPITDFFSGLQLGTFGIPGTITYRFRGTSEIAAQIQSITGFDQAVTVNNLPNQNILANGVITGAAFAPRYRTEEFQDQLSLTAQWGEHQFTAGGFVSLNKFRTRGGGAGVFAAPLASGAEPFDITLTSGGVTYQVTDPSGYGGQGRGILDDDFNNGTQNQYSFFLSDTWQVTEKLSIDAAARYEKIDYRITNGTKGAVPGALTTGGADGNVLTLYDNGVASFGPSTFTARSYDFLAYSGSVAYRFNDDFLAYARYTKGKKAPDYGGIQAIDEPIEIATLFPEPQVIEQIEVGLKYSSRGIRIAAFPFYSKLSNVGSTQLFTDSDGLIYSPPTIYGSTRTYGVEFSADADVSRFFNLRAALTVQEPTSKGFGTYTANTGSRSDDVLVSIPTGDADVNPKVIANATATFTPIEGVQIFLDYSYLGKRAANQFNAFYLPAFSTVGVGASFEINEHFKIQANVTNLFNNVGIYSWAPSGSFLAALDRQVLTPAAVAANPNQLFSVVPSQPRAFFVTGSFEF